MRSTGREKFLFPGPLLRAGRVKNGRRLLSCFLARSLADPTESTVAGCPRVLECSRSMCASPSNTCRPVIPSSLSNSEISRRKCSLYSKKRENSRKRVIEGSSISEYLVTRDSPIELSYFASLLRKWLLNKCSFFHT